MFNVFEQGYFIYNPIPAMICTLINNAEAKHNRIKNDFKSVMLRMGLFLAKCLDIPLWQVHKPLAIHLVKPFFGVYVYCFGFHDCTSLQSQNSPSRTSEPQIGHSRNKTHACSSGTHVFLLFGHPISWQ